MIFAYCIQPNPYKKNCILFIKREKNILSIILEKDLTNISIIIKNLIYEN
jgi:hypothetical protein